MFRNLLIFKNLDCPMSLKKIEKYIEILLHLHSHENTTINHIVNKFDITYSTVRSLFKKWIKDKYISKVKIKGVKAGEPQYTYHLTNQGIDYLSNLTLKLNEEINKLNKKIAK